MAGQIEGLNRVSMGNQGLAQAFKGDAMAADAVDADQHGPRPAHRAPDPIGQGAIGPTHQRGLRL
jgi:hypothetical protein